ncbi:MAG: helix-turn-helix domain-containing protein [Victivallaceae bacterium]|nr:helix-turn-helix domain-containing protein [Victivallaceae bacterium]
MDLKLKDVADLLQVSHKTVYRWIQENKIPCYRINRQYRFNQDELKAWMLASRTKPEADFTCTPASGTPVDLVDCIRRGGIYYRIAGTDSAAVIRNAVNLIPLPAYLDREVIVNHLLQREAVISTSVGGGIAVPHPQVPVLSDLADESISICFPEQPVDFHALDREAVFAMFIVLSANPRRHLEMLGKIMHLCRLPEFRILLQSRALRPDIIDRIRQEQLKWNS